MPIFDNNPIFRKLLDKYETFKSDIEAVRKSDPAARKFLEIILAYPGLHALWMHRIAHSLWRRGLITIPRMLSHFNRFITGIEIHPGAKIAKGVFIDHGMGVVIGETAEVGEGCLIYKGVVLGGTSLERKKRHPNLGRNVVVGSNACILGPVKIGDGVRIGAGSVVINDVPDKATVVGVPGKIVPPKNGSKPRPITLDHANLPDPVIEALTQLIKRHEEAEERIAKLEHSLKKRKHR